MVEVATRVLIAGGGVAALEAALALRELGEGRVSVEMLAPEPEFWYRPLAVAEPFDLGEVMHFDLVELAAAAGATFSPGALSAVDVGSRLAQTSVGSSVPYDVLLIACGAGPIPAVAGALTFRGPADTERMRTLLEEIVAGRVGRGAFVVPWGAVWSLPIYELALMTAAYLAERGLDRVELALVTPEEEPLQLFGRAGSEAVRELLEERGIALQTGSCPVELVDGELRLVPEGTIAADRVCAGRGSTACRRRSRGSCPSTRTVRCAVLPMSSPPATSPASRSSRAESLPSRQTQPPRRSRPTPARTSRRSPSGRCCAVCC